jgi:hypothetical protein
MKLVSASVFHTTECSVSPYVTEVVNTRNGDPRQGGRSGGLEQPIRKAAPNQPAVPT